MLVGLATVGCSAGTAGLAKSGENSTDDAVAYTAGVSESDTAVHIVTLDGDNIATVKPALFATFSRDGSRMAYFHPDLRRVVIANSDGNDMRPVGGEVPKGAGVMAAFSPKADLVAYSTAAAGACAVNVVGVDGTGDRTIVEPWECHDGARPSFTADGRHIAFSREVATDQSPGFGTYLVDLDTLAVSELPLPLSYEPTQPSFSSDGSRLTYQVANEDGTSAVYIADGGGNNPTKVVDTDDDDFLAPTLSADGSRIVYSDDVSQAGDHNMAIFVIDADGSNRRQITHPSAGSDGPGDIFPVWTTTSHTS